jgi:hypothetical protein
MYLDAHINTFALESLVKKLNDSNIEASITTNVTIGDVHYVVIQHHNIEHVEHIKINFYL